MAFAELSITSNFTFLTGGSHPQEHALRAIELGLPAFAIADRNSVAGLVRAHHALREARPRRRRRAAPRSPPPGSASPRASRSPRCPATAPAGPGSAAC